MRIVNFNIRECWSTSDAKGRGCANGYRQHERTAMAQGSGSYYEDYMRSNALLRHCGEKNAKKLLTDRGAYISFLEVQLERVSAACLTTQTFEKRLAELEAAQTAHDERVGAVSKVLRLNQEYIEQTSAQTQSEMEKAAAKTDTWLDKLSTELQSQRTFLTALEEQAKRSDEFVQRLAMQTEEVTTEQREIVSRELEDLRTLLFAHDTRVEELQNNQRATDERVRETRELATEGLDKVRPTAMCCGEAWC